jgi:hypothetical protein
MFKYSLILIIITSRIILKIIYMCLEFQMEHNICMRILIYELVNRFLFYISTRDVCFATYYFANVQWYTHFQAFVCIVSEWLLSHVSSVIFQLYHGENKLIFNEMTMRSALY